MSRKQDQSPQFLMLFKIGQIVKTPDGERKVECQFGATVMLDYPVGDRRYWSQDEVKGWQDGS